MKTSELTGAALDWAVATCEGLVRDPNGGWIRPAAENLSAWRYGLWTPSNNWAQGGAIIEREKITVSSQTNGHDWAAKGVHNYSYGTTPLIAAMRCYVASKMGDEVQIPEELKIGSV